MQHTSIPDLTLKKKLQSIPHHFIREGATRDEWRTAYVNAHDNPADLLTKAPPMGEKQPGFVHMLQHHIFGTCALAVWCQQARICLHDCALERSVEKQPH